MNRITAIISGVVVLIILFSYGVWMWGFCRFYVPAGSMAIITSKEGADLPPGQILAQRGQKGIWAEPLGEGRHFLNPIQYDWKIVPALHVPAGKVGIATSKVGKDLPSGEFLADDGQKGVWRRVLGPGLYRLNPDGYQVDIIDAVSIPIGYVGVLTSLSGEKAPEGEFANAQQKGIMGDVLQPGLYYLNPKAYKVDVLEVGLNQVTFSGRSGGQVNTKSKIESSNKLMDELGGKALKEQQAKRSDYIQQNYYAPQAAPEVRQSEDEWKSSASRRDRKIAPAEKPLQQQPPGRKPTSDGMASFELPQVVEFPSRDGFEILLDMTVEFELQPSKVAWTFMHYGDLPAVVDKILLPQILSVSRLKGSSYKAQDFIIGEGRERFQNDLKDALVKVLAEKRIEVHNSLIRHVELPKDILQPIQQGSVAKEQNLTNIERQNTARKQAELNVSESMIDQRRQEVLQETQKLVAEIAAQMETQVATIQAQTQFQAAQINKEKAAVTAETTRTLGEVKANVMLMVEGEKANGYQMKAAAARDGNAMVWLKFAEMVNPDMSIRILHAGEGTLWTDLTKASMSELGGAKILGAESTKSAAEKPAKKPVK